MGTHPSAAILSRPDSNVFHFLLCVVGIQQGRQPLTIRRMEKLRAPLKMHARPQVKSTARTILDYSYLATKLKIKYFIYI